MEKHTPRTYHDTIHLWHFLGPMLSIIVARSAAKHNINGSPGTIHDRSDGVTAIPTDAQHDVEVKNWPSRAGYGNPLLGDRCVVVSFRLAILFKEAGALVWPRIKRLFSLFGLLKWLWKQLCYFACWAWSGGPFFCEYAISAGSFVLQLPGAQVLTRSTILALFDGTSTDSITPLAQALMDLILLVSGLLVVELRLTRNRSYPII